MKKATIPFQDRISCTIAEACAATGLGQTKIKELVRDGRIASALVDDRRLIVVASLKKLMPADASVGEV